MDQGDLDLIESVLGIRLPAEYRALILAYPFARDSLAEELWLLDDPEQLLEINQFHRRDGFFGMAWPTHYFVVGGDGLGNAYFLDLREAPAPVLLADHETLEIEAIAQDLQTWVPMLVAELAEIEADQRAMAGARANKRWWQFWIR